MIKILVNYHDDCVEARPVACCSDVVDKYGDAWSTNINLHSDTSIHVCLCKQWNISIRISP